MINKRIIRLFVYFVTINISANIIPMVDTLILHDLKAKHHQTDLTLMLLELDHLKNITNKYGHPFEDLISQRTTTQMLFESPETDILTKYSDEIKRHLQGDFL